MVFTFPYTEMSSGVDDNLHNLTFLAHLCRLINGMKKAFTESHDVPGTLPGAGV